MKSRFWVLDGHEPVPTESVLEWGRMMEDPGRIVAQTEVAPGILISTVFLGIDHGFRSAVPILFETMGFNDYGDEFTYRYATWAEAELGHMEVVEAMERRLSEKVTE